MPQTKVSTPLLSDTKGHFCAHSMPVFAPIPRQIGISMPGRWPDIFDEGRPDGFFAPRADRFGSPTFTGLLDPGPVRGGPGPLPVGVLFSLLYVGGVLSVLGGAAGAAGPGRDPAAVSRDVPGDIPPCPGGHSTAGGGRRVGGLEMSVPTLPEDEDKSAAWRSGFYAFAMDAALMDGEASESVWGWEEARRRCYGQGVKAGVLDDLRNDDRPTDCPYPQFSGAWEAWTSGYSDGDSL